RHFLEVRLTPVPDRGIAEVDAVPGRAADVRLDHDETAIHEELSERIEPAEPLPGGSAVHVHEGRQLLPWRDIAGPIEQGGNLPAVEGLVPDVFRGHEALP